MSNRPDEQPNKAASTDAPIFFEADAPQPDTPVTEPAAEPVAAPTVEQAEAPAPTTAPAEQPSQPIEPTATDFPAPASAPKAPAEPPVAVALGDKASQFAKAQSAEPSMVSLADYSDTPLPAEEPAHTTEKPAAGGKHQKNAHGKKKPGWGCFKGLLYTIVVVGVSLVCTYLIIGGILDVTGLQKSDTKRRVDIAEGATTSDVADALEKADLIDQKLIFRLYSKLTKADGTYQPGTFYLTANMGYSELIRNLQEAQLRETVTVTIPEGSTVENVARLLSENGVCKYDDFYTALLNGNFEEGHEFLKEVPKRTDKGYEDRIYWLEGYLFPDTYEFYVDISAEDAIDKLLSAFDSKLDTSLQTAIKASGKTLDEVITLASIVQGESADTANMPKVARVILNRLDDYAEFPYLQCDSTGDYIDKLSSEQVNVDTKDSAYNTYTHMGLPPGPINNPSLAAIKAVVNPSKDKRIMQCYYFANDKNRNTYYSETYEEHMAICQKYGIGIHAN